MDAACSCASPLALRTDARSACVDRVCRTCENPRNAATFMLKSRSSYPLISPMSSADYSHLEVQVLRQLSESGVLPGMQAVGEEVRYNDDDLFILRRVRRLYEDLGVNLEGIEIILRLQARLEALQRELDQYKKRP